MKINWKMYILAVTKYLVVGQRCKNIDELDTYVKSKIAKHLKRTTYPLVRAAVISYT